MPRATRGGGDRLLLLRAELAVADRHFRLRVVPDRHAGDRVRLALIAHASFVALEESQSTTLCCASMQSRDARRSRSRSRRRHHTRRARGRAPLRRHLPGEHRCSALLGSRSTRPRPVLGRMTQSVGGADEPTDARRRRAGRLIDAGSRCRACELRRPHVGGRRRRGRWCLPGPIALRPLRGTGIG